jgi:hypothetical protein
VNENKKIIIFLVSIPIAALIIIFVISKVKFAPSFSPVEQKGFSFAYENTPRITERKQSSVSSIKNPIDLTKTSEQGFPKASLEETVPPPAATTEKRISFILVNRNKKLAIIDGKLVHEGDKVDNHTVARIEKDKILLKNREGEKWLKLD